MKVIFHLITALTTGLCAISCNSPRAVSQTITSSNEIARYVIQVEEELNHSTDRYTQGLFFHEGQLYESAGQYGESAFFKTDFESGKVLSTIPFPKKYFLEGACVLDDKIYIITWNEGECFVYDLNTLKGETKFRYKGEGWGLTTDGKYLIMSDGTSLISFRDPKDFSVKRQIPVSYKGKALQYINELEYIDGKIWANVYTTDKIVIINPNNGVVEGEIDCTNLLKAEDRDERTDVLNGIAINDIDGSIYITGKYWPKMFRVKVKQL